MKNIIVRWMAWLVGELRGFVIQGRKRDILAEDGRQIAKAVTIAGILGMMTGQISSLTAVTMVVLGIVVWLFAARLTTTARGRDDTAI